MKKILVTLVLFSFWGGVHAESLETTQLTFNNVFDGFQQINKRGDIAWVSDDGVDYALKLYSADTQKIIDFDAYPWEFILTDNGDIIWQGWDGADYEIFQYNAKKEAITQLTNNDFDDRLSSANKNGDAAWTGPLGTSTVYVFTKDKKHVKKLVYPDTKGAGGPLINKNGDVVWQTTIGADGNPDLLLYDADTGKTKPISSDTSFDANFQIDNKGNVAWNGYENFNKNVYLYQKATMQITALSTDNTSGIPQMNSKGDVLWTSGSAQLSKHFIYTAKTKDTVQIGGDYLKSGGLSINKKGNVVWQAINGSKIEVYFYDSKSESIDVLKSTDAKWGGVVDLVLSDKNDVAWSDYIDTGFEVFYNDGKSQETTQITATGYNDGFIKMNQKGMIVWTYFDPIGWGEIVFATKQ